MIRRNIEFSPPDISEEEIQEVANALRSGWITTGPRTKLLERRLAAYIETGRTDINCETEENIKKYSNRVVCLNSATAAEELNLRILGIGEGDEVIVPAYTYTATASAAIHCGATVKFIDIQKDGNPDTHMPEMDYDAVEKAITPKTKAIIPVDFGGILCDYEKIIDIVNRKKDIFTPKKNDGTPLGDLSSRIQKAIGRVAIVADSAHSLGASRYIHGEKKYSGAIADFTSFSFHAVKNFTTGEGGAATWLHIDGIDNEEIYKFYQLLSLHGQNKDALCKSKCGGWEYDIIGPWHKCNMTDIMAAIGNAQLDRYLGLIKRRILMAQKYDALCEELRLEHMVYCIDGVESVNHLYVVRIPDITIEKRNQIIKELAENGISTNVHFKPLPLMTAYKGMSRGIENYPNSLDYYRNLISLPFHTLLSDEDIEYVCQVVKSVLTGKPFENDKIVSKEEGCIIKPFDNKVWLSSPTMHGEELEFVTKAYKTNWMSTVGENINEVEKVTCQKIGCNYAVALSAGTAALHMAMKLAGQELYGQPKVGHGALEGKYVFASDMTFDATVNPIVYEGGIPIFIDTEEETWNMDPVALEKAFDIYPEVKLVVIAHLYGTPGKVDELKAVCEKHGAIIIEDAAESLGASYKGIQTGTFGKYNCISFNGNKIITGSSGGMLLTDSEEAANKVRKWSTQARENAPWYQHEELGYNYRMSNVIAGVVRGQFLHLEEHIAQKKAIYYRYKEGFKDLPVKMNPYDEQNSEPNYWLSCLLINKEAMCKQVLSETEFLYRSETGKSCPMEILDAISSINAEGRPIWKPMHMQPIYRLNPFITRIGNGRAMTNAYIDGVTLDVGMDIFNRGICLPSDNKMKEEQQEKIIEVIKSCFR